MESLGEMSIFTAYLIATPLFVILNSIGYLYIIRNDNSFRFNSVFLGISVLFSLIPIVQLLEFVVIWAFCSFFFLYNFSERMRSFDDKITRCVRGDHRD